ncbi:MAG TPA: cupredoxin domain-containing protein [Candidatus Limnocylindria bacterium]|nr:cupredoxin domain-containing protein [Candidatus Limnocylindria bacterium]
MDPSRLVRVAAASEAVAMLFFAATHADRDAAALGIACLIGLALLSWRRGAGVGRVLLGLLFLDVGFFTASAAASLASNGEGVGPMALQVSLAAISIVGLLAVIATFLRRPPVARPLGRTVAAVAIVAGLVAIASAGSARPVQAASQSSSARVETKDTAYSNRELTARAGEIRIEMTNSDLFWHTFTIDALGVDLRVPLAGTRTAAFTAAPGVYPYYCQIPGHASAGMRGTLTVR